MKTEVYSWRLSSSLKDDLEGVAREEGLSLGALLERTMVGALSESRGEAHEQQERLQRIAAPLLGTISGRGRAEYARQDLREKLRRRRAVVRPS